MEHHIQKKLVMLIILGKHKGKGMSIFLARGRKMLSMPVLKSCIVITWISWWTLQAVSQGLWNVANFAVMTNLVLYFVRVLQMSNASAANNVTNWFGTQWLLTLLGGFLGDAYWGRFKTCMVFQVVHIVGLVILGLCTTVNALIPPVCTAPGVVCPKPSSLQVNVFMVGLYIIALGSGGYLPAFLAWGADQFDSEKHKTVFFSWLLVFQNVGSILANTLFVWLENNGEWALAFWLATGTGILAFLLFASGMPTYRQYRPSGNSFARLAQVMIASARKWRLEVPKDSSQLYELPEKQLHRQGSRKITHTPRFRFFDKAATQMPGELEEPWRLCNVTQVEELKCLCRMLPIWLCAIPFAAVFAQINTLFVEQAAKMDLSLGSIKIPPASLSVINVASMFVFTLIYPWVVVPIARMFTGRPTGMTQLQRLGWGQVGVAIAMAVAALVEGKRLMLARAGEQMSVFWLSPQYILLGGAQVKSPLPSILSPIAVNMMSFCIRGIAFLAGCGWGQGTANQSPSPQPDLARYMMSPLQKLIMLL